jgi:hypothetical protein
MTLTAGDYQVTAWLSGYVPQTLPATVAVSQTTTLDFALEVAPPEIELLPTAISVTMLVDQASVKSASVRNLGEGPLNFTITNPEAAGWLGFTPENGQLDPAASQAISVTLDTSGLGTGVYPGRLEIASDDPDTPLLMLPVSMTVVSACVPISGLDFTWTRVAPLAGEEVTFYASLNGSQPAGFYWDFGDGITSTIEMPGHIFTPGTYTVTLTTSNDCGEEAVSYPITVAAPPWLSYLSLVSKK